MKVVKANRKGIQLAVQYLKAGKAVAYPTDTCYGLAVDATNFSAVRKLYRIKQRRQSLPVHIIVPSVAFAKRIADWSPIAQRLSQKFWPGPLSLVLPLQNTLPQTVAKAFRALSARTGTIGLRMPDNRIALALVRKFARPITTPSANPPDHLGGHDSFSASEVFEQFLPKRHQPDLLLDGGRLPQRKPSTFVKISKGKVKILRPGPISAKRIRLALKNKFPI